MQSIAHFQKLKSFQNGKSTCHFERVNLENVPPVGQIGIKKLSLLAKLDEIQRDEITEFVTSVLHFAVECKANPPVFQ